MERREKILVGEDLDMSSVHAGELSQSSGVISLPSANRLADLSLASDLTDSEFENEGTVLTSSACGNLQEYSNGVQDEKIGKIPNNFLMKSCMLPYSQRLVNSLKQDPNITDRQSENPSVMTKEKTKHDCIVSDGKLSKDIRSDLNIFEGEEIAGITTVSLDDARAALQQHCNLLSDRQLLKDLFKSLDDKIEQEPVSSVSIQPHCSSKNKIIIPYLEDFLDYSMEEEKYKQLVFNPSVMYSFKSQSNNSVSNTNFNQGNHVVGGIESFVNPQVDPSDDTRTCGTLVENLDITSSSPIEQGALQKGPSFERHVKFQSATTSTQIEGNECGDNQELECDDQQSLKVLK